MIIKTSDLTGYALNYAVILAKYPKAFENKPSIKNIVKNYPYSTEWAFGGPIIERERINLEPFKDINGEQWSSDGEWNSPTPLIAAMRAFVASKLGDEVEVPDELC